MILPIILTALFLVVGIAYILKARGVRLPYVWLLIAGVVFAIWILLLFIPVENTRPIAIDPWFRISDKSVSLSYSINPDNWELIFLLIGMLLAYLMTSIVRLKSSDNYQLWALVVVLFSAGILSISADTLWSLVIGWTLLDFLIIGSQILTGGSSEKIPAIYKKSTFKLTGSLILIGTVAFFSGEDLDLKIINIPGNAQPIVYIASLLHAGIFPFTHNKNKENPLLDLLDAVSFLISFLASFSLFIRTSASQIEFSLRLFTMFISAAIALLFSNSWAREKNRKLSFTNLLAAGSLIIFLLLLRQDMIFIKFWLIYFSGLIWFLICYKISNRLLDVFPTLLIVLTSILPFALLSLGARNISLQGFDFIFIVIFFNQIVMHAGLIRKVYEESGNFFELDPWFQTIYSMGLFLFIFSIAAVVYRNLGSFAEEISHWAFGFAAFISSIIISIVLNRLKDVKNLSHGNAQSRKLLYKIFSFEWFTKVVSFIQTRFSNFFIGLSGLLEGEGGIFWSLVLIILLISVLRFS